MIGIIFLVAIIFSILITCVADMMFDIKLINYKIDHLETSFYDKMFWTENKFRQLDTKYSVSSIRFKKLEKEIDK